MRWAASARVTAAAPGSIPREATWTMCNRDPSSRASSRAIVPAASEGSEKSVANTTSRTFMSQPPSRSLGTGRSGSRSPRPSQRLVSLDRDGALWALVLLVLAVALPDAHGVLLVSPLRRDTAVLFLPLTCEAMACPRPRAKPGPRNRPATGLTPAEAARGEARRRRLDLLEFPALPSFEAA